MCACVCAPLSLFFLFCYLLTSQLQNQIESKMDEIANDSSNFICHSAKEASTQTWRFVSETILDETNTGNSSKSDFISLLLAWGCYLISVCLDVVQLYQASLCSRQCEKQFALAACSSIVDLVEWPHDGSWNLFSLRDRHDASVAIFANFIRSICFKN